jgi:hypothetical protein
MAVTAALTAGNAIAEDSSGVGLALRAGTTGIGADVDVGLLSNVSARLGYSGFDYNHSITNTNVTYTGKLKVSDISALFDWYPFHGGFRLTAGIVGGGLKVGVTGQPTGGTYTINNTTYTAAQVGSLTGQLKFGNSASPYVGLGWGDPVGTSHHLHFLFDVGAIYGGTPNVMLTANCGVAAPPGSPICTQLQSDVLAEKQKLQNDVTIVKWYPVVTLGLAYRF